MEAISKNELQDMMNSQNEDFVLINVLSQEAFGKKHIPSSISIPNEEADFVETVEKVAGSKQRKIVVYCASFECNASPKAAKKLEDAGFTQVFDYEGGLKDWFEGEQQQAA